MVVPGSDIRPRIRTYTIYVSAGIELHTVIGWVINNRDIVRRSVDAFGNYYFLLFLYHFFYSYDNLGIIFSFYLKEYNIYKFNIA